MLSHILRTYHVYSTRKEKDWRLSGATTLKRRDGFLIRIERRPSKNLANMPVNKPAESEISITDHIMKTMEKSTDDFKTDNVILAQRDR